MSLKENIDMVKDELNSEEKFFESAVKTERFVKKYKNALIGTVVAVVVVVSANALYVSNENKKIAESNVLYESLLNNAQDQNAQDKLKVLNPDLYDLWKLSQAIADHNVDTLQTLKSSKAVAVSDLATYELASLEKNSMQMNSYSMKQEAIYKELAIVQSALLLMREDKIDLAHDKLSQVSQTSPLYKVSKMLMHYGVK